mmetsp:Transcript_11411/g.19184  ORF Transcript_11411/g.19184 Transcript_11411/m.19184 type:complete len:102 (-) Transcript_11411:1976-2281(-)
MLHRQVSWEFSTFKAFDFANYSEYIYINTKFIDGGAVQTVNALNAIITRSVNPTSREELHSKFNRSPFLAAQALSDPAPICRCLQAQSCTQDLAADRAFHP